MSLYDELLDKAYGIYVTNWCRQRGYNKDHVNPITGINGECFVCKAEFADCEFADADIAKQYLTDVEYGQYKMIMEVDNG